MRELLHTSIYCGGMAKKRLIIQCALKITMTPPRRGRGARLVAVRCGGILTARTIGRGCLSNRLKIREGRAARHGHETIISRYIIVFKKIFVE